MFQCARRVTQIATNPHAGSKRDKSVNVPPATSKPPLAGVTQAEYFRRLSSCFIEPCAQVGESLSDGSHLMAASSHRGTSLPEG